VLVNCRHCQQAGELLTQMRRSIFLNSHITEEISGCTSEQQIQWKILQWHCMCVDYTLINLSGYDSCGLTTLTYGNIPGMVVHVKA